MACTAGSEPKPGAPSWFFIPVRDVVCALWGEESIVCKWASWGLGYVIPSILVNTAEFCDSPPNCPDSMDIFDFASTKWAETISDIAKCNKWSQYCQCKKKPPDPTKQPPFKGGQCVGDNYGVTVTVEYDYAVGYPSQGTYSYSNGKTGKGPVKGVELVKTTGDPDSQGKASVNIKFADITFEDALFLSARQADVNTFKIISIVVYNYNNPSDNCGDPPVDDEPPDQPEPPPPLAPSPDNLPPPPAPPPAPPGPPGPPGKDAPPCIPCKDGINGKDGNDGMQGAKGDKGDSGLPGSSGAPGTPGAMGAPGSKGDKGDKGDQGEPGEDAEMKFTQISVPTVGCVDYIATISMKSIFVIEGTEDAIQAQFEEAKKMAVMQCEVGPPISAIPDWWQVRLNADIPQLVVIFGPTSGRQYHDICIPHPKNTVKQAVSPIPAYTKGSWLGMVICRDNSKFIINAVDAETANALCNYAISAIDPAWLESPPRVYISERKGKGAVTVEYIRPRLLMYHPLGQKHVAPEWRVVL